MKKVELLSMQIRNIMGDMLHKVYANYLTPDHFNIGDWTNTLVVDATDAPRAERDLLWKAAKAKGVRILRASYEGRTEIAGGLAVVATSLPFQKSSDNGGNYASPPSESLSFMAAGLAGEMIQEMVRSGKIEDKQIEIPVSVGAVFDEFVERQIFNCENPDCPNEVSEEGLYCAECVEE